MRHAQVHQMVQPIGIFQRCQIAHLSCLWKPVLCLHSNLQAPQTIEADKHRAASAESQSINFSWHLVGPWSPAVAVSSPGFYGLPFTDGPPTSLFKHYQITSDAVRLLKDVTAAGSAAVIITGLHPPVYVSIRVFTQHVSKGPDTTCQV